MRGRENEQADTKPRIVACVECGCPSGLRWAGWRAYRVDEPEYNEAPAIAFYCPACAVAEFDHG